MLWIGMIARNTGIPASSWLEIKDKTLALNFEAAVAVRLNDFENERMRTQAQLTAIEVSRIFSGSKEPDSGNAPYCDRYADMNTRFW